MASSSWHILSLFGTVVIALGVDGSFNDSTPPVVAPEVSDPSRPGVVVLHFGPAASGESARPCRQEGNTSGRVRTLFQGSRTADGELLTINGHVALRFKPSITERQIDSLIAATGVEAFPSVTRSGCRRYVFSVVHHDADPIVVANGLQASGLVDYAAPDLSAGRPEGVPSDSFFVDQLALTNSITKNSSAVGMAPATYGMGQVLSAYTGPVMRIGGAEMAATPSVNSSMSALDLVKSHGLTTLRLAIPERGAAATVRVMLYSLTGTPIRQLVSEALEAGLYIVGWDGKDDSGRHVQPGVYVAVMTAGNFRETRRLVVR